MTGEELLAGALALKPEALALLAACAGTEVPPEGALTDERGLLLRDERAYLIDEEGD